MISKRIRASGISKVEKLPKILAYPKLLPLKSTPMMKDILCYVIKHYGIEGLAVLIYRQPKKDQIVVQCGDWKGNNIDLIGEKTTKLGDIANHFVQHHLALFLQTMRLVRLEQAQFFFAIDEEDDLVLVDIQVSVNKMAGPGMLRDIFGKIFKTQEVLKIEVVDERALEYIKMGSGTYGGDLILKPSRYRIAQQAGNGMPSPLYVEVRR